MPVYPAMLAVMVAVPADFASTTPGDFDGRHARSAGGPARLVGYILGGGRVTPVVVGPGRGKRRSLAYGNRLSGRGNR
jgi:hypothetical protein